MATSTATIRVTRETRERLGREAHERGISLSALLAELARDLGREELFRGERAASRVDSGDETAGAEERDWEAPLDDGID